MATISPRLLPLIETLINVGADWLAVELIETLNQGRWPEESEEALALTRAQVRDGAVHKRASEPVHKLVAPFEVPPKEQVAWAAAFVAERLDGALSDLAGSLVNLDAIIGDESADAGLAQRGRSPTTIRLDVEVGSARLAASDVENARAGMQALRGALARWARDADGQQA